MATTLTRWEPFRELADMRRVMDQMFDESLFKAMDWPRSNNGTYSLALDVAEQADGYVVKASLPGANPEDVEVTLQENVLTIKGETKSDNEIKEENYHVRERRHGSFMRSVTLPAAVESSKVEATHENGVLTLRLPKSETVKPKKIAVKGIVNPRAN